jgi:serine/threonine protein kinase
MSPETIELPDGMRRLKVGRPSDVWSLGCILYQMVYGHPPFQHLSVYQKMKAIPDTAHAIEFPEYATPTARPGSTGSPPKKLDHLRRRVPMCMIGCMKKCLARNPKERVMIPELLEQEWLGMKEGTLLKSLRLLSSSACTLTVRVTYSLDQENHHRLSLRINLSLQRTRRSSTRITCASCFSMASVLGNSRIRQT